MKTALTGIALAIITIISGCSKNDKHENSNCEKVVLVDKILYGNTISTNYMITDASISGDCLEIKFGSSGCDSKSWVVELVDAELITDSAIPQRSIKLVLTNKELCAAAFGKTVSFDLRPLRVNGSHKVSLSLSGLSSPIIYNY